MTLRTSVAPALAACLAWAAPAPAQTAGEAPQDIGTVSAASGGAAGAAPDSAAQTAAQFAPSAPSLDQTEPTSTLAAETLRKIIVPTENYNDIIRLTPSAVDVSPVGPGLQQDFYQSIRGLQYTQFSVLYDGIQIPGFPFNFAPQPGVYFTSNDLGSVTVHRGPGQASAIGTATFGGYVDLASPSLENDPSATAYGTYGSFATRLGGVEAQTGLIGPLEGGRALIDVERLESGGASSGSSTEKRNLFLKVEQPIGDSTVLTAVMNLDNTLTKTPDGATIDNINTYGRNYALNENPTSQSFRDFNVDHYTTDFEYVGVKSDLGRGLTIEDKLYTTAYYQRSNHGFDVGGLAPNLSGVYYVRGVAPEDLTGDVPGTFGHFDFRNSGNVLRLSQDTPYGQLRAGVWSEYESGSFYFYQTDATRGYLPYAAAPGTIYNFNFDTYLTTIQPYVEFAWKPRDDLTVTAGVKYSYVERVLKGAQGFDGTVQDVDKSYSQPLPSFDVNWRPASWASVYAQAASGFLTPSLNLFSTAALTSVTPSSTDSYQLGGVVQTDRYSLGTDIYYIKYNNYVNSRTLGAVTTFFNQGGAKYQGVEVEGTAKLGGGAAVYANGSINSASYDSNRNSLAQTPRYTAAFGPVFDRGDVFEEDDDVYASLITKFVGPQYGVDTSAPGQPDQFPIKTYAQVDFSAGYTFPYRNHRLRVKFNVYNLADDKSIIAYNANTIGPPSQPLFFVNSGRSAFVSLAAKF